MTLYELFTVYILPNLFDLTAYEGFGERFFFTVFVASVSLIIVDLFVVLPYKVLLKVTGLNRKKRG